MLLWTKSTLDKRYTGQPSSVSPGNEDERPGGAVDIKTEWHQGHCGLVHLHAIYGHLVPELVDVCAGGGRVQQLIRELQQEAHVWSSMAT